MGRSQSPLRTDLDTHTYQHKTVTIFDQMYVDVWKLADRFITVLGRNGVCPYWGPIKTVISTYAYTFSDINKGCNKLFPSETLSLQL